MTKLRYRPHPYDDWGMIRNPEPDDGLYAVVRRPEAFEGEFGQCRDDGADPFAGLAAKILNYDQVAEKLAKAQAALREIADEAELHTKLNQERLCCKFQHIAAMALEDIAEEKPQWNPRSKKSRRQS